MIVSTLMSKSMSKQLFFPLRPPTHILNMVDSDMINHQDGIISACTQNALVTLVVLGIPTCLDPFVLDCRDGARMSPGLAPTGVLEPVTAAKWLP